MAINPVLSGSAATEPEEPEDDPWQPAFLVHAAISPSSRWIAYFGTNEYPPCDGLGEIALHSLSEGELKWHRPLNEEIIGKERFEWRDYYDHQNNTEIVFVSEHELACSATCGAVLFFDTATGAVTRRHYFDTKEDVLSISFDRASSTLWAALKDGSLHSMRL